MSPVRTSSVMKGNLLTVLHAVQLGFLLVGLSTVMNAYDSPSLAILIKSFASLGGAAALTYPVHLARVNAEDLSAKVFLTIGTIVLLSLIVAGGGIYSISMLALPLALIFSAFFASSSTFLPLFISSFLGILLIGLNNIYDWAAINEEGFGEWFRLKDGAIIILVSGYATWIVGKGLRRTFANINHEKEEVMKAKSVIQTLANTDVLTGLLNRSAAKDAYEEKHKALDRERESIAFYFIDLDHFKSINDLFDHSAGDALLVTVAKRLDALRGETTAVARLGGDEFVVFEVVSDEQQAVTLAEKIRLAISESHNILGAPAQVTASIGVTKVKTADFDTACKEADIAMYKIKHAKRNGFQFYSTALHKEYMKSVNVVHGLQNAVEKELLALHYQPKVDLKTGEIIGVEALLRWVKDNPNQYGPGEFMPIVESTELVHEIGNWSIYEACSECSRWHQQGYKISIAINVSPMQLSIPSFYTAVEDALKQTGLDPHYLEIELTEHLLIKEKKQLNRRLERLTSLGVSLAIDDFGTGYSNLGYLTQLRVDVLKLDRSFIIQMGQSHKTLTVIRAIIGMARVLKLKVVAEGVEEDRESECLIDLGCDIGQGYLWSKPLGKRALFNLLKNTHPIPRTEQPKLMTLG